MEDTDVEDLIIDLAWRDYNNGFEDKRSVENRVGIILAANGILIGLITASNSSLNSIVASISAIFFLFSSLFGVLAIYFRDYKYLTSMDTWNYLNKNDLLGDIRDSVRKVL